MSTSCRSIGQENHTTTGYLLLMKGEASLARSGWLAMIRAVDKCKSMHIHNGEFAVIPCGLEVENSRLWRVAWENYISVNIVASEDERKRDELLKQR